MNRTQKVRLYPTFAQETLFRKAAGVARFAWNWGLALANRYYRACKKSVHWTRIQKKWDKIKSQCFPWAREVASHVTEQAFRKLGEAFVAFLKRQRGRPKFKKKGRSQESYCGGRGHNAFIFMGRHLRIPRVGKVRFRHAPRWPDAAIRQGRITFKAGVWWAILMFDLPDTQPQPLNGAICGVDLGCITFATVSSGGEIIEELPAPKPYAKAKRKLRRVQRSLSRCQVGSRRRAIVKLKLARMHGKIADIRADFLHKFTTRLVARSGVIVLEDLCVKGLARGRIAGTIHDLGFGEFRKQVMYKAQAKGVTVILADRFFPSSKQCNRCGHVCDSLSLDTRQYTCAACGHTDGRDRNAAKNLEQLGQGLPKVTHGETGDQSEG